MSDTRPYAERHRLATAMIAILAGLAYPLAFAPYNQTLQVYISIALLWLLIQQSSRRHAFQLGFLYGLGQFGLGVSWVYVSMHVYGDTGVLLSILMTSLFVLVLALFPAVTCWLTAYLSAHRQRHSRTLSPLLFIACWMLLDTLRGWISSGFPWLYAGYATLDTPLDTLAAYGGVWLLSLIVLVTAIGPLLLLTKRWATGISISLLAIVAWVAAYTLPALPGVHPTTETPKPVALVQGNVSQAVKWEPEQQAATRKIYAELNQQITNKAQLVVWSESAITEFYRDVQPWIEAQAAPFADAGGALISGLPRLRFYPGFRPVFYNSIVVVAGGDGIYNKQKLVPFGEYVPFANLIRGLIPFFDLPMSSFTPGKPDQANLSAMGDAIAPFVCYDVVFPWLVAHQAEGSQVLLEVSDDAWFGESAAAWQHHQIARMRSIETGRYLLRDTNTGITAIIDAQGKVTQQLPLSTRAILEGHYQPMTGSTPFMGWGKWLAPLITLILLLAGIISVRRQSK